MTLILSQNHVRLVVVSFYLLLSNTIELIDVIEVMILSSCHHHDEVVQLFAHHFEKEIIICMCQKFVPSKVL